jgi:hypothetical protein
MPAAAARGEPEKIALGLQHCEQRGPMKNATLPIVLIAIGAVWLMNSLHWLPRIEWLWILGLIAAGAAILFVDGVTKSSIVAGPLLIVAGVLSFLHLYYGLAWRFMFPVMLICGGVFMLAARSSSIPESRRFQRRFNADDGRASHDPSRDSGRNPTSGEGHE